MHSTVLRLLSTSALLIGSLIFAESQCFADKTARVYVDSVATDEYAAKKGSGDEVKRETYHFVKGNFFGGRIRDGSLDKVTFNDIVQTLARDLAVRNYYPAEGTNTGDLLIVVHWGVTSVDPSIADLMGIASFGSPDDEFGEATDDSFIDSGFTNTRNASDISNAKLLGFDKALQQKEGKIDKETLRSEIRDERYFMILMAYDWQKLLQDKEFIFLWSTRFIVNSIGTNFTDSYLALSRAAQGYFGSQLDTLTRSKTHFGEGEIKFGELEVIDWAEKTEDKK